jgi:hypothetical protein
MRAARPLLIPIKVEGIGNYAGTVTGRFTIGSYSVNNLTVVPIDNQIYTGKLVMPTVQLADGNGNVLTDGFSVKFADNYNPGTATLTFRGLTETAILLIFLTFRARIRRISELLFQLMMLTLIWIVILINSLAAKFAEADGCF